MRRLIFTLFIIIGIATATASAQTLLDTFKNSIAALGEYRVEFTIELGEYKSSGSYIVSGDNFYITTPDIELYVADGVKYEVNSQNREIVVDSTESLGSDILSNPARCFDALSEQFKAADTTYKGLKAVCLTPQEGSDRVVVTADGSCKLPKQIVYISSGEELVITINSISSFRDAFPLFKREKYPLYELIDMR